MYDVVDLWKGLEGQSPLISEERQESFRTKPKEIPRDVVTLKVPSIKITGRHDLTVEGLP